MVQDQWSTSTQFDLDGRKGVNAPIIIEDEEDCQPTNLTAELLQYHHWFGLISFQKLAKMAKLRMIPKRLAKCPTRTCSACLYAKAIQKPWPSRTISWRTYRCSNWRRCKGCREWQGDWQGWLFSNVPKTMKVAKFDSPFEQGSHNLASCRAPAGGTVRALPGTPTDRGVKDAWNGKEMGGDDHFQCY
jgi:hypothetical protein